MTKVFLSIITTACLIWTGVLFAENQKPLKNDSQRLNNSIEQYQKKGYAILGPVQFLEKTNSQILFFRQPPVSYTRLRVVNLLGIATTIKRNNYAYVFTKNGNVVMIRLKKEFENEE